MSSAASSPVIFRECLEGDFDSVYFIINEAATAAYAGKVPAQFLTDPYMSREAFRAELAADVRFWGLEDAGALRAVMGMQRVDGVMLIRHAYVRTDYQRAGLGSRLLEFLLAKTRLPVLVGTWSAMTRTHRFYERHGFAAVPSELIEPLLTRYWTVPAAQRAHSIVLSNCPVRELPD